MKKLAFPFLMLILLAGTPAACSPLNAPDRTPRPSLLPSAMVVPTGTASPTPAPSPTASPIPTCSETNGRVENGVIETGLLDKPMTYNVYLPPCYGFDTAERYPVIYLLHGLNFDENQWVRIGVPEMADRLISSGEVSPFIVVMPYDYSFKQPTEYPFEEVFLQQLLPAIDSAYATRAERAGRAIGGLSRGSGWALWIGLRNPQSFTSIGAHSPGIFYAQTSSTMILRMQAIPPELQPVIFLDAGDSDVELERIDQLRQILSDLNYPHEWRYYIGFHNERYWRAHLEEYLRWYDSRFQSLP